jgi:hypothetical protein
MRGSFMALITRSKTVGFGRGSFVMDLSIDIVTGDDYTTNYGFFQINLIDLRAHLW